jgi:hypothetical protein
MRIYSGFRFGFDCYKFIQGHGRSMRTVVAIGLCIYSAFGDRLWLDDESKRHLQVSTPRWCHQV